MSKQIGMAVGITALTVGILFADILLIMAGALVLVIEKNTNDS
jgi:hypothetical protein